MNTDLQLTPTNPDVLAAALWPPPRRLGLRRKQILSLSHHLLPLTQPHTASQKFLFNHSQLETIPHQGIIILHLRSHVQWSPNI